jgi:class 3 adenylate cyclase
MAMNEKDRSVLFLEILNLEGLNQDDERATARVLKDYLRALDRIVLEHEGRLETGAGDRHLALFSEVVGAVSCGLAVGKEFGLRNAAVPDYRRVAWRMGVGLGEVREDRGLWEGGGVRAAETAGGLACGDELCVTQAAAERLRQGPEAAAGFEIEAVEGAGWGPRAVFRLRPTIGPIRRRSPGRPRGLWAALLVVLGLAVALAALWKGLR